MKEKEALEVITEKAFSCNPDYAEDYGIAKGYLEALEKAKEVIFLLGEMIKEARKNPDHSALVMYAEEALERWEKEK